MNSIYVSGFSELWTAHDVLVLTASYGKVNSVKMAVNKNGKPFAIVRYSPVKAENDLAIVKSPVEEAVYELNGGKFMGARIRARIYEETPRYHVYRF